ncbi:MAG: NEW3 domain-containing protein [Dehalococcoidia bacterium]
MVKKVLQIAVLCILAFTILAAAFVNSTPVNAAQSIKSYNAGGYAGQNDAAPAETLDLTCQYPVLSGYSGLSYSFTVSLTYKGSGFKTFDLKATVPDGFTYSIYPGYGEGQEIAAIRLDGTKGYGDTVKLTVNPFTTKAPPVGEYPIVLTATSGDLTSSIDLKGIVTANYDMKMATPDGRLNTEATSGQDNNVTIQLTNTGSGDLENVNITSGPNDKPNGWTVTCKPDKLDLFKSGDTKEIQVTIRPTDKTISGDYMVSVTAQPDSKYAFANLQLRVTVLTPTIWGWVGVGIVVLVVLALAVIFMRFGRR